jgi:hypothetical protein
MINTGGWDTCVLLIFELYANLKSMRAGIVNIDVKVIKIILVRYSLSTPPFFSSSCIQFFMDIPKRGC